MHPQTTLEPQRGHTEQLKSEEGERGLTNHFLSGSASASHTGQAGTLALSLHKGDLQPSVPSPTEDLGCISSSPTPRLYRALALHHSKPPSLFSAEPRGNVRAGLHLTISNAHQPVPPRTASVCVKSLRQTSGPRRCVHHHIPTKGPMVTGACSCLVCMCVLICWAEREDSPALAQQGSQQTGYLSVQQEV